MTTKTNHNSEARAEQAASKKLESIKLGLDVHAGSIVVVRILDHSAPQPAQKFLARLHAYRDYMAANAAGSMTTMTPEQLRQGMESTKTFDKPEVMIPVGCDVHPWMRSFIAVVGHPFFAVSKDDGTYEIKGLPAGEYEIEAWHEKLKTQTQKVTVKDGEKAKADFSYKS